MKKTLTLLFLLCFTFPLSAQQDEHRGTIKVEKKGRLAKVVFDDVNYRLIGIDQYGNILDSAVIEFQMSVTIKGIFYSEKTVGPVLTYQMQQLLGRCDNTSTILFQNIKAQGNKKGTVIPMPAFRYKVANTNEDSD